MRKLLIMILLSITIYSCESGNGSDSCSYNGHTLYTGEKGGCYYLSSGGNKEYVDRSYCKGCN